MRSWRPAISRFRLCTIGVDGAVRAGGYLFCLDEAEARAAALRMIDASDRHAVIRIYDDKTLVVEVRRDEPNPPAAAAGGRRP